MNLLLPRTTWTWSLDTDSEGQRGHSWAYGPAFLETVESQQEGRASAAPGEGTGGTAHSCFHELHFRFKEVVGDLEKSPNS